MAELPAGFTEEQAAWVRQLVTSSIAEFMDGLMPQMAAEAVTRIRPLFREHHARIEGILDEHLRPDAGDEWKHGSPAEE
jgi:hypothetical protein